MDYIFFLFDCLLGKKRLFETSIWQIIFPLLGVNLFTTVIAQHAGYVTLNLVGEWFTTDIIILYLFYPILRESFKSKFRPLITLLIIFLFLGNFHVDFLIYQEGHISLSVGFFWFWIGFFFEEYKSFLNDIKLSIILLSLALLLWIVCPEDYLGIKYLPNVPIILLFYASSFSISKTRRIYRWICKYSYIVYLIHHNIMNWMIPVMGSSDMGFKRLIVMLIGMMMLIFSCAISEYSICVKVQDFFSCGYFLWNKKRGILKK